MSANLWPVDAVSGSPSYSGRALRQAALGVLLGGGSGSRPLAGRSGVNPRTPATTVTATSSTWTVAPHSGVIDAEASALAGSYAYSFDTNQTGSVTAANGSNDRIDLISVQVSDPAEGDGSSTPGVAVVYTAGTPSGSPVVPATPARALALAQIRVPRSGTGSPVVTWVARNLAAAGGLIVAADSSGYPGTPFDGAAVYDQSNDTIFVYNGSAWRAYAPACGRQLIRASSINVTNNTPTSVASFDSTSYNVGDLSYAAGVITVGTAGLYRWEATALFAAAGTAGTKLILSVLQNGAAPAGNAGEMADLVAVNQQERISAGGSVVCAAGDTLQLSLLQNSGSTMAIVPSVFTVTRTA